MKAIAISEHGGPEVVRWHDLPAPTAGPKQVLVRIRAVGVNHLDIWVRKGMPQLKLAYPHVMGTDLSGVVEALGASAGGVSVGDEVIVNPGLSCMRCRECLSGRDNLCRHYGLIGEHFPGGAAELFAVPDSNVVAKPKGLSFVEAAALPVAYLTAWQMLVLKARLQPGETVFVHALGSGVGTASLQIAKLMHARVIGSASTPEKRERAKALGADEVLDSAEDLAAAVKSLTGKRGADVVVEHTGEKTWNASILMTTRGGRIVTCGATTGFAAETDLRHVFFRQIAILGSTMGPKGTLSDLAQLAAAGPLRPIIDSTLPLGDAAEAHRKLEARTAFGKIVLTA
jgi:NADPH:quinone reductase-like Zn-dependent oxidoreductase